MPLYQMKLKPLIFFCQWETQGFRNRPFFVPERKYFFVFLERESRRTPSQVHLVFSFYQFNVTF